VIQWQKEISTLFGELPLHLYQAATSVIVAVVGTWVSLRLWHSQPNLHLPLLSSGFFFGHS